MQHPVPPAVRRRRTLRRWARTTTIAGLLALLAYGCQQDAQTKAHDDAFDEEGLLLARAKDLKSTVVTPHLEQALEPERNVLWCSTFQVAWNEACALLGEDIRLENGPPIVPPLNKKTATKEQIDEASYVALAGHVRDGIFAKIDAALKEKFRGQATPSLTRPEGVVRPQDLVAYCYLFKNLEFPTPFQRLDQPLDFAGAQVACFGAEGTSSKHEAIYGQVAILDYQSPDDFVIELKTKSKDDRFLLAKMPRAKTLGEAIASVQERIANAQGPPMVADDLLKVPKLNFDITREYDELYGQLLKLARTDLGDDLGIVSAIQNIRYQLDEKGVRLRSESHIGIGCAAAGPRRHTLVFDKPFLMMLQRAEAKLPYFALWVETPEILVRATPAKEASPKDKEGEPPSEDKGPSSPKDKAPKPKG